MKQQHTWSSSTKAMQCELAERVELRSVGTASEAAKSNLTVYIASVATSPGLEPVRLADALQLTTLKSVCAVSPSGIIARAILQKHLAFSPKHMQQLHNTLCNASYGAYIAPFA